MISDPSSIICNLPGFATSPLILIKFSTLYAYDSFYAASLEFNVHETADKTGLHTNPYTTSFYICRKEPNFDPFSYVDIICNQNHCIFIKPVACKFSSERIMGEVVLSYTFINQDHPNNNR